MFQLLASPAFLHHVPQYLGDTFGLSELALLVARRSGGGTRSEAAGSLRLLWAVIIGSVVAGIFSSIYVTAAYSPLLSQLLLVGVLIYLIGLIVRWYAILYLGRFFTVNVAIAADHRVIDTGPYKYIRHPSYSGALLIFLGMAISFQNWLGFAVLLVQTTLAFLRRIDIEEMALRGALGDAYINYSAHTRRLIQFVY